MHELIDVEKFDQLSKQDIRDLITKILELSLKEDQLEMPLIYHFSKNVFGKEMRAPKGAFIVGKIHRYQNLNIISQGDVSVFSIDGVIRVRAPHTFVASPGAQRVIYCHEDTVWTTILGTDETDVDKIEDKFIAKSYDELQIIEE